MFGSSSIRPGQTSGPYTFLGQYATSITTPSATALSEIVIVPPELAQFAGNPQFFGILLKVKDQSGITTINVRRNAEDATKAESIEIGATTSEGAMIARKLVETHFVNQIKLNAKSRNLQKVQTELFSVQGEMASGTVTEFNVDIELVGLVIGAKGGRIKQVESETGCKANVDGKSGRVVVSGPDNAAVQKARELLDLKEQRYPLKPEQVEFLSRHPYEGTLSDIRDQCGLLVARVDKTQLLVVGPLSAVNFCSIVLPTQLEYVDKQIGVEGEQRLAFEQLRGIQRQFGGGFGRRDGDRRDTRIDPHHVGRTGAMSGPSGRREGGGDRERTRGPPGGNFNSGSGSLPHPPSSGGDRRRDPPSAPQSDRPRNKTDVANVTSAAAGLARISLAESGMLPEKKPRERGGPKTAAPAAAQAQTEVAPAPAPEEESRRKRGSKAAKKAIDGSEKEKVPPLVPAPPSPRESAAAASAAPKAPKPAAASADATPESSATADGVALEKRVKKPRERGPKPAAAEAKANPDSTSSPVDSSEGKTTRIAITEGEKAHHLSFFSSLPLSFSLPITRAHTHILSLILSLRVSLFNAPLTVSLFSPLSSPHSRRRREAQQTQEGEKAACQEGQGPCRRRQRHRRRRGHDFGCSFRHPVNFDHDRLCTRARSHARPGACPCAQACRCFAAGVDPGREPRHGPHRVKTSRPTASGLKAQAGPRDVSTHPQPTILTSPTQQGLQVFCLAACPRALVDSCEEERSFLLLTLCRLPC
jgi:hypothetical protein